jgi:hypothetical protein
VKPRVLLPAAVLLVLAGAAAYFFAPRSTPPPPAAVVEPAPEVAAAELPTSDFLKRLVRNAPSAETAPGSPPPLKLESGTLPWEKQVVAIVQNQNPDNMKAQELLALLPSLPEDALAPVTAQALELVRDSDYVMTALPLLLAAQTHGAVVSELFRDLMERPDTIVLPTLLAIARLSEHPYATAAHDNLNLLLGQELESNWAAWENAINQRLAGER